MPVEESRDIHSRARRLCPVITVIRLTGSTTAIYSLFRRSDGNDRLYRSPIRFDKHVTINAGKEGSRLKLTAVRRIGTGRGRPLYLRRVIAARRHLYALARLHERSCFFAQLSANCFSSCFCRCLLERIFKHQFSDLMFDGDRRGKREFLPNRYVCIASSCSYLGEDGPSISAQARATAQVLGVPAPGIVAQP